MSGYCYACGKTDEHSKGCPAFERNDAAQRTIEELQRILITTQAQVIELRQICTNVHDMILRGNDDREILDKVSKALSATADNEQAVNRIKAQALRELIERYPFFKDREVAWLLGSIKKDIDDIGWRREMSEQGCCWPEQNAIWEFCEKYGIDLSFQQESELKNAVTAPRIEIQHKVESLRAELAKERNDRRLDVEAGIKRAEKAEAELEAERQKVRELENELNFKNVCLAEKGMQELADELLQEQRWHKGAQAAKNGYYEELSEANRQLTTITAELNHYKQLVEESRKQEPVAWQDMATGICSMFRNSENERPLYAAPIVPQEVPEGWQLVPKELTHHMEHSMDTAIFDDDTCQEIWGETLAAAPEAPKGNANCK